MRKTPRRPLELPPDRHCRVCGAQLDVRRTTRRRVGGLFSRRRQWVADMACPRCGAKSGVGWATLEADDRPTGRLGRLRSMLPQRTGRRRRENRRRPFVGPDGRLSHCRAGGSGPVSGLRPQEGATQAAPPQPRMGRQRRHRPLSTESTLATSLAALTTLSKRWR